MDTRWKAALALELLTAAACRDPSPPRQASPQAAYPAPYAAPAVAAPPVYAAPVFTAAPAPPPPPPTYAARAALAVNAMRLFFVPETQMWRLCVGGVECSTTNHDWGADSLTYDVWFRYTVTRDPALAQVLAALDRTGPEHKEACRLPECKHWSDVPEWDSLAASREYEVTHDPHALERARDAFTFIDTSDAFWFGACPSIAFQLANGKAGGLKTLETDSNYVKSALALFSETRDGAYLKKAVEHYAAIRKYYLDPAVPLYTVWVVDNKEQCRQIPRRFYGSVNGNMIVNGLLLAKATHRASYREEALATARAVDGYLSDPAGIYEDLQAENDIVEPLVEAFYDLATQEQQPFARAWILRNAEASESARAADGTYGRFWGGPRPRVATSAFMTNGGFALAFAAAAIAPDETPASKDIWASSTYVAAEVSTLPARLEFTGRAIALLGTIGEHCCEKGHAHLFVDGVETFDRTGIWQNKSSAAKKIPDSVLFAWRWPESGHHTLEFQPGEENPKEGHSFLHLTGYQFVP